MNRRIQDKLQWKIDDTWAKRLNRAVDENFVEPGYKLASPVVSKAATGFAAELER